MDSRLNIVYIFHSEGAGIDRLIYKILPELEVNSHQFNVLGMCFFDQNAFILRKQEPVGRKILALAKRLNIVLMSAQSTDLIVRSGTNNRVSKNKVSPSDCVVVTIIDGIETGCFPGINTALNGQVPDHYIAF